jgi:hypothetical protein
VLCSRILSILRVHEHCRERAAQAYDTCSYFVAKFFAELPVNVSPGLLFGTIIYWLTDLQPIRFGYFLLILGLEIVTAISLGLAVGAASPTPGVASAVGIPIVIVNLIFGGFYSKYMGLARIASSGRLHNLCSQTWWCPPPHLVCS